MNIAERVALGIWVGLLVMPIASAGWATPQERPGGNGSQRLDSQVITSKGIARDPEGRLGADHHGASYDAASKVRSSADRSAQVRVLYVFPQDRTLRGDYFTSVRNAIVDVQSWYKGQLSGRTFSLFGSQPEICHLPRASAYYSSDTWAKVLSDVQACAPVSYNSSKFVWVLYVDVVHACNAPGRLGAGRSGLTILPRQDMDGLIGARYFDDCGIEYRLPSSRYVGGLAHELGHALGLGHPPGCESGLPTCDSAALMWAGYASYPGTYLRTDDKEILLASPFTAG